MPFKFEFTKDMLAAMVNNSDIDEWYDAINRILPDFDIDTPERVAGFIAQCAHESGDFKRLEENLNYSEKALNSVFGRYFGEGKRDAAEYARNPEKIANYVYMDEFRSKRGALGNVKAGDGWRFRGRGLKQLTGRNNYKAFADSARITPEKAAEYLETKKGAVHSACWFWKTNNLNRYADKNDIVGMTKKINGGTIGLEDRTARYEKAMAIMTGKAPVVAPAKTAAAPSAPKGNIVKRGSTGTAVKEVQRLIGVSPADGIFGPGTEAAVKAWQTKNGLTADGIVGPATKAKMSR